MARNLKKDYIMKLVKMEVPNGYKFDLANYLHNPSYGYDYPSFIKMIDEDENTITMRRVRYFKYYNGTGEYQEEIYILDKADKGTWQIVKKSSVKVLESSNRFNVKKLIAFC